jgi:histidinol-phosphate phosphatase family protein
MSVEEILVASQKENPIQACLLTVLLDGGRIISTGDLSEALLTMVPDVLSFEKRDIEETYFLSHLSFKDLIFVEKASIDQLWKLAKTTGAQVAMISDSQLESELVDFSVQEKDLRSAILNIRSLWNKIEDSDKEKFSIDGPRDQKILFLDRDGVIIEDTDFVKDPEQVTLLPGVIPALKEARAKGYRIAVVTNQSGIGRGLISWPQYDQVTLKMQKLLAVEGIILDKIALAAFHSDSQIPTCLGRKSLRKPRPGMFHQLKSELRADLSQSVMVGDKVRDLISATLAGVPKLFLIKSNLMDVELQKWKEWPLLNRVPPSTEMITASNWAEISKKL